LAVLIWEAKSLLPADKFMTNISKKNFLVDTNILIYALDKKSLFFKKVVEFFEWSEDKKVRLFLAHQNLLELIRTLINDYGVSYKVAEKNARGFIDGEAINLISPLPSTLSRYFNLTKSKGVKRGNIFDYYLAATALDNGVDFILTNNADDFSEIEGFTATTLEEVRKIIGEHE